MVPPESLDDGRYQLRRPLGKGGTAAVFEAYDRVLGISVAIKVLAPLGALRPGLRRRLRSETVAMRRVHHRNVLRVFDIRSEGEVDYVVMDLAPGGSLQDRLDVEGALPIEEAVGYTQQILAALAAAHVQGVVHRDVKPHNVLLDGDGVAMLADFGIALLLQDDESDDRRTKSGVAMGSFAYMPPEQRIDAHEVDQTADVYATGATLYALLTAGNPVDLFTAGSESVRWSGIPTPLVQVIRVATRQSPGERYPDAPSFGRALDDALERVPPEIRASPIMYYPSDHGTTDIVSRPAWMRATREAVTYLYGTPMPGTDGREPTRDASLADGGDDGDDDRRSVVRDATWRRDLATGAGPEGWGTRIPTEEVPLPPPPRAEPPAPPAPPAPVVEPPPGAPGTRRTLLLGVAVVLSLVALGVWGWDLRPPKEQALPSPTADAVSGGEAGIEGAPAPEVVEAPPAPRATAKVAAPKVAPKAAPEGSPGVPVVGTWRGGFNGSSSTLELRAGGAGVEGTFTTFEAGGRQVGHAVGGSWDPESRHLLLTDRDADGDAGTYSLRLSGEHGDTLSGTFSASVTGRTVPVALHRP